MMSFNNNISYYYDIIMRMALLSIYYYTLQHDFQSVDIILNTFIMLSLTMILRYILIPHHSISNKVISCILHIYDDTVIHYCTLSFILVSAPRSRSSFTISSKPFLVAIIKGVSPCQD